MANKRDLKKAVRRICGGVAGECVLAMEIVPGIDKEKMGEVLVGVADLQQATLRLISVSMDRTERDFDSAKAYNKARRSYYKSVYGKLNKQFEEHLDTLVKEMNEAMPADQREANKAAGK